MTYYPTQEHEDEFQHYFVPRQQHGGQMQMNHWHGTAGGQALSPTPQIWHQLAAAERKVAEAMGTLVSLRRQARSAPPVRV